MHSLIQTSRHYICVTTSSFPSSFPKPRSDHFAHLTRLTLFESLSLGTRIRNPSRREQQEDDVKKKKGHILHHGARRNRYRCYRRNKKKEEKIKGKFTKRESWSVNEWFRTHQAHDAVCAHARSVLGFYSGRWSPE